METAQETPKTFEEFETEEEYQAKRKELRASGFEEGNTHANFTEEEVETTLRHMLEESKQTNRIMVALKHGDNLTIWIEHPLFSDPEVQNALNKGFRLNVTFPPNKERAMRDLLKVQHQAEERDYMIIPIGKTLTLWMKTIYIQTKINIREEINKVIKNLPPA